MMQALLRHRWLLVACWLPWVVLVLLDFFAIPLGRPNVLAYPYSTTTLVRVLLRIPLALPFAAVGIWQLHRIIRSPNTRRPAAGVVAFLCFAGLCGWTMFASVAGKHGVVHIFNLESPSHDGAFLLEAQAIRQGQITIDGRVIHDVRSYLHSYPELIKRTPEEVRGTRVLSNPPGMTLLCLAFWDIPEQWPKLADYVVSLMTTPEERQQPVANREMHIRAYCICWALTLLWLVAVVPAYGLGRLWMEPAPALVFALAAVFNPATVNFTPGKDPAQLLTVLCLSYGLCRSYLRGHWRSAVLGGLALGVGCGVGLIHVWVAFIWFAAFAWDSLSQHRVKFFMARTTLPCFAAVLFVFAMSWWLLEWNVVMSLWAVAQRYGEIQKEIITHPIGWTFVGAPLFILFAGPGLWATFSGSRMSAGGSVQLVGRVLIVTGFVLAYTYFFANNSETPRLWIPFIPILILCFWLRFGRFQTQPTGITIGPMIVLAASQILVTLLHWSLLDAREAEMRLLSHRYFW